MSLLLTRLVSASLIGLGLVGWASAGRSLVADPDLAVPLNALGINGSPYGEVFAMAMQGPIDADYLGSISGGARPREQAPPPEPAPTAAEKPATTLLGRFKNLLASLDKAAETRTNPAPPSPAHRFYLRRQVEDKLRFANQLDPAHYANYNSLHFFLTEPQLGTRPALTPSAARLAAETIRYCLKQPDDPRPALTAAAAVTNVLELMFNEQREDATKVSVTQMHQQLELLDFCIARYVMLAQQWDQSKGWDLLSPMRIIECEERFRFIGKIREAAFKTIERIEGKSSLSNTGN